MSRILLIETDRLLARNISYCLEERGYSVDWQVDPQAAIISLDVSPASAIILDLMLAGRSGIEFLYELRSYSDWKDIPVFIYSSLSKDDVGESLPGLQQLGIEDYYHKSYISPKKLVEHLSQKLNEKIVA
jgi:DNA-binding response OmpR family regulator